MENLEAISPIDGRYRVKVSGLEEIFSEKALNSYRIEVETEYLIALSEIDGTRLRKFSSSEIDILRGVSNLSLEDAKIIKQIETKGYCFGVNDIKIPATNHDVKAIEYFIKQKLKGTSLEDCLEWVHFGLTSEDVNNIAYGLMLSDCVSEVMLPVLDKLYSKIEDFAVKYRDVSMLARTHGQAASPTTFGKEFKVFSSRMRRQMDKISEQELLVKLNGATGNYNAHYAAYPNIDWLKFSSDFVSGLNCEDGGIKLKANLVTTQIEPHDSYIELFDSFKRLNNILIDFSQDIWRYISDGWLKQKIIEGEVGSSTMPHKINPIDFENAEGNLGMANAMFEFFSRKLAVSRLQRDLSDSTVQRNYGTSFAHSLIAYKSLVKGLDKISVDYQRVSSELASHASVVSEGIQTILRAEGFEMPYEKLKKLTRGKEISLEEIADFVSCLDGVSDEVKALLKEITPENYVGLAGRIVDEC